MKKIYISYAHRGEGKQITEALDKAFQARGVRIVRDIRDVAYKKSFGEFMAELGAGEYVITVIDKPYLESYNCMHELIEVYKNKQFRERIFPIVLPDAEIYDTIQRLGYIKYWEEKIKKLNEAIRQVDSFANTQSIQKELNLYTEIRHTFDRIVQVLTDMNAMQLTSHRDEDFKTVFEAIHGEIGKKNDATPPPDPPPVSPEIIAVLKKQIQADIGKNRIKEAIAQLTTFTNEYKPDLISAVTGIQREHDEIKRQKMRGTLTYSEVSRETNKIISRIFEILDSL